MRVKSSGPRSLPFAATAGLVGLMLLPVLVPWPSAWSLSSTDALRFAIAATVWAAVVVAWVSLLVARAAEQDARARADEERHEMASAVEHLLRDRNGFLSLVDESDRLVAVILRRDSPRLDVGQALQTLTGHATMLGLTSIVTVAQALEQRLDGVDHAVDPRPIEALGAAWQQARQRLGRLVGPGGGASTVVLSEREHDAFLEAIAAGAPRAQLAQVARAWRYDTGAQVLTRVGGYAVARSRRLGKEIDVVVNDDGLRFASATWAPLWSTIVHAVSNAVDHGLDPPAERMANARAARGQLTIEARFDALFDELVVALRDDGQGADWSRLHDGGVGLDALRTACADLGGTIKVRTGSSGGTVLEVRVPHPQHVVRTIELIDRDPGINVASPSLLAH